MEIIYPATKNVIPYEIAVLQFHNLVEYDEFGSGNFPGSWQRGPKTDGGYKKVTFYSDDLFLQLDKDTLNQGGMGFGSAETSNKPF